MRHTGLSIIGNVPWGTHFCQFYNDKRDLTDLLVPYFKAGLENNEFCMWVTSYPLGADEAYGALNREIPDLDEYVRKGQIEILDYTQWYKVDGSFDSGRVLQGWVCKLEEALRRGFAGLRLTGNTFWLETSDWDDFRQYEETVDGIIGRYPMLAMCTYSLAKCGAAEIMDVVANHEFALIKRSGEWQMIENAERRRIGASLRESERRYLSLFRQMAEGFALHEIICDANGRPCDYRFLEVNPAFERLMRFDRGAMVGKTVRQVLPEVDDRLIEIYGKVALTGEATRFDYYSRRLNRHYSVLAYRPMERQFAILATDITERKQAEQAVIESGARQAAAEAVETERNRFKEILDRLPVMVCLITPDYRVPFANRQFREVFGDPEGRTCYRHIFNLDEPCFQCESMIPLKTGQPHRWVNPCPGDRLVEAHDFPFTDVDGSPMILEFDIDITERRRMEEELRKASHYARTLLEASLDPLVTISPEGRITDVNEATELVTGVPRTRLVGSDFSEYFTEPDKARAGYLKVFSEGLVRDYPLTIRHSGGGTTDVLYNAVVYRNEAGEVQGIFAAARDITERKRAESELARYRDHLEDLVQQRTAELEAANTRLQRTTADLARSNQELEQFAYVASHDLQEPLRAVAGYLSLLEKELGEQLDERGRHHLTGAVQGAQRMHTLISDLLALSRVGTRGQKFEAADLNAVLDHAIEGLSASVQETGATITRDPLPTVRVDAGQAALVFQNLIGNALKFRSERRPEIHVGAERQSGQWIISVRDNGIGIEPQYFERIFMIFQRLHTRRKYPGTGIGLAICKKIVQRHGGSIWVESEPGRGSTFYFAIPSREMK